MSKDDNETTYRPPPLRLNGSGRQWGQVKDLLRERNFEGLEQFLISCFGGDEEQYRCFLEQARGAIDRHDAAMLAELRHQFLGADSSEP